MRILVFSFWKQEPNLSYVTNERRYTSDGNVVIRTIIEIRKSSIWITVGL